MKKILLAGLSFVCCLYSYAQTGNNITIGTIDTVQSTILNEKRKILVYVPKGVSNSLFARQSYPVVYLLDGDRHFNYMVGMIQQLSQISDAVCPEMIVVGISNTNRNRDLTPTKSGYDPFLESISPAARASSGGGEAFLSFIEKELMPYIESKYPTQPYRMLVGHSFGGLTVMNALINHTKLFNTYVAIDPSMFWDNLNFLRATKEAIAGKDFGGRNLYLAIANTMDQGMDIKRVKKDTAILNRGIRASFDLDDFIRTQKPKGLRYASKYYGDDTHNSVPLIAAYDALRFIFAGYQLKLENKDVLDSTVELAKKFEERYRRISGLFGYEMKPPEMEINAFGYRFLQRKQFKKSEDFFKLNIKNYPESFNVYDAYGDFFVAVGDKAKAIENFKKALVLKDNTITREKLNKLLQ